MEKKYGDTVMIAFGIPAHLYTIMSWHLAVF